MNSGNIVVLPRAEIPTRTNPDLGGVVERDLGAHELLARSIPPEQLRLMCTELDPGQETGTVRHKHPSMLLILRGSAFLAQTNEGPVERGDVVTVPAGAEYRFEKVGSDGLEVLRVDLEPEGPDLTGLLDFRTLLDQNEARCQKLLKGPFFLLLADPILETDHGRWRTLECVRVFADAFQTLLFTRQAMCQDTTYSDEFHHHLEEELGHNRLLRVNLDTPAYRDPVLRASSVWFCHQMMKLDNLEKTVVNLVLETAGYHLGTIAGPRFAGHDGADYFDTHGEADEEHQNLGVERLANQHPETYRRLHQVLDENWDMLETMTQRLSHLIRQQVTSS